MNKILKKEMKLSASCISFFFILFGFMFLIPGYPILCGVFFVTLGIFKSFENTKETNDILFSALLPISKKEVVQGKVFFSCFIEGCSLILMAGAVILRNTLWVDAIIYRSNFMMNANGFALGLAMFIFGCFNLVFISGFFKTAYRVRSFVPYIILCFLTIGIGEALHHFPGFESLNAFGTDDLAVQLFLMLAGCILFLIFTGISVKISYKRFERIDL